ALNCTVQGVSVNDLFPSRIHLDGRPGAVNEHPAFDAPAILLRTPRNRRIDAVRLEGRAAENCRHRIEWTPGGCRHLRRPRVIKECVLDNFLDVGADVESGLASCPDWDRMSAIGSPR